MTAHDHHNESLLTVDDIPHAAQSGDFIALTACAGHLNALRTAIISEFRKAENLIAAGTATGWVVPASLVDKHSPSPSVAVYLMRAIGRDFAKRGWHMTHDPDVRNGQPNPFWTVKTAPSSGDSWRD